MSSYSYVVARDYGFAPNPFHGFCTLATCKPLIRRMAAVGDWVVGTGSSVNGLTGHLVYAMQVTEAITFDDYFADPRFAVKKPNLNGSRKQAFGDNIYYLDGDGPWQQLDSHHALPTGSPNPMNVANDTQTNRVLLSTHFAYFGANAPQIPQGIRTDGVADLVARRGYKCNHEATRVMGLIEWFELLGASGLAGRPSEWSKSGALKVRT